LRHKTFEPPGSALGGSLPLSGLHHTFQQFVYDLYIAARPGGSIALLDGFAVGGYPSFVARRCFDGNVA